MSSGLTPKKAGFQTTRSASLPTSIEADLMRDPVRDRRVDRVLGDVSQARGSCPPRHDPTRPQSRSEPELPNWVFILCAVCQVRVMTSPTRPIAWLSLDIIENAPKSCNRSSAAIVSARMRDSAKATSSGMLESR